MKSPKHWISRYWITDPQESLPYGCCRLKTPYSRCTVDSLTLSSRPVLQFMPGQSSSHTGFPPKTPPTLWPLGHETAPQPRLGAHFKIPNRKHKNARNVALSRLKRTLVCSMKRGRASPCPASAENVPGRWLWFSAIPRVSPNGRGHTTHTDLGATHRLQRAGHLQMMRIAVVRFLLGDGRHSSSSTRVGGLTSPFVPPGGRLCSDAAASLRCRSCFPCARPIGAFRKGQLFTLLHCI